MSQDERTDWASASRPAGDPRSPGRAGARATVTLFAVVVTVVAGQSAAFALLPPLGRSLGIGEPQIGLVVTVSSLAAFLASPVWGRLCGRLGARWLLLIALGGSCASLYLFAAAAAAGLASAISGAALFLLILAVRGVLFGTFLSAVLVASYTLVSQLSSGPRERVSAVARLQAANGAGLVIGPALGGLLAEQGFLLPLLVAPSLGLLCLVPAALLRLPAQAGAEAGAESPSRLKARDGRVLPFLAAIFLVFLALGLTQITLGFLVQDRLGLASEAAARRTGLLLGALALVLVATQLVLVRLLGWPALRLLLVGIPPAAAGLVVLATQASTVAMFAAMLLLGLGLGFSQPGAVAAPTLAVAESEQGALAGLISAANTLAFVVGPAAGSSLYGLQSSLPYLVGAIPLCLLMVVLFLHPMSRGPRIER